MKNKEIELPETTYSRTIDNHVFQGIILQSLAKVAGISLLEGNVFDQLLGRPEGVKGIHTEQDPASHTVRVRIEVNIAYGESIPQKADEIQNLVVQEISKMTGLHVAEVHVLFKGLSTQQPSKKQDSPQTGEYSDIF